MASTKKQDCQKCRELSERLLVVSSEYDAVDRQLQAHRVRLTEVEAKLSAARERRRLPVTRPSITRRFSLPKTRLMSCPKCRHQWTEETKRKIYVVAGMYEDGSPGELFIHCDRLGSTAHGFADALAIAISIGLQYGVPLSVFVDKMIGTQFGASGFTGDKEYPRSGSVLDLVMRWLQDKFLKEKDNGKA